MTHRYLIATLLVASTLGFSACVPDNDALHIENPLEATGQVAMPLVATSASGTTYRLSPARFRVTAQDFNQVFDGSDLDRLNIDLLPGEYQIELLNGWAINLADPQNDPIAPLRAVLQSPNPQAMLIEEGDVTQVVFQFGVGEDAIAFGEGRGEVIIEINDGCVETTWYADQDRDGFGDPTTAFTACEPPVGFIATSDDCDDANVNVNPDATEVCGGADDDCDGQVDEELCCDPDAWFLDADGDGFGAGLVAAFSCDPVPNHATNDRDCDDAESDINPAARDICNGVDDNCDGEVDIVGRSNSCTARMLVTSTRFSGDLGSLTGADQACQTAGETLDPSSTWIAFIAQPGRRDMSDVLNGYGPFRTYREDENFRGFGVIADDIRGLLTEGPSHPIIYNELEVRQPSLVWTGMGNNGRDSDFHCQDWTSNDVGEEGTFANNNDLSSWLDFGTSPCAAELLSLYCVQISPYAPL